MCIRDSQMLQVDPRPQWRVVQGGSSSYIRALRERWNVRVRLNCPVYQVTRQADGVTLASCEGRPRYDQVVFACHSDQALKPVSYTHLLPPAGRPRTAAGAVDRPAGAFLAAIDRRAVPVLSLIHI